uniref:Uncharacterized protein n=1 Tax=Arundo donax TaxID=35708 RepID=A0A0A9E4B8_ARUDO
MYNQMDKISLRKNGHLMLGLSLAASLATLCFSGSFSRVVCSGILLFLYRLFNQSGGKCRCLFSL